MNEFIIILYGNINNKLFIFGWNNFTDFQNVNVTFDIILNTKIPVKFHAENLAITISYFSRKTNSYTIQLQKKKQIANTKLINPI